MRLNIRNQADEGKTVGDINAGTVVEMEHGNLLGVFIMGKRVSADVVELTHLPSGKQYICDCSTPVSRIIIGEFVEMGKVPSWMQQGEGVFDD